MHERGTGTTEAGRQMPRGIRCAIDFTRLLPRRTLLLIAALSMALSIACTLPQYFGLGGTATAYLRVGTAHPSRPFIEQDFTDVFLTADYGHDGQQFYVLAATFPNLEEGVPYLDIPNYRARRIVFPAMASLFPRGPALAWALYALNVLSVGAAAAALARIAHQLSLSPLLALAVPLNPAMIESVVGSLADAMAFALALWGVALWRSQRWAAVALITLAVLTRETTVFAAIAVLVVDRSRRALPMLIPVAIAAGFSQWLKLVLPGAGTPLPNANFLSPTGSLGVPFGGMSRVGLTSGDTVVLVIVAAIGAFGSWHLRRVVPVLVCWFLADVLVLMVSDEAITGRFLNGTRVIPLAVPLGALGIAHWRRTKRSNGLPALAPVA